MDQTEADKLQAEEYKTQGNKEFKANNYTKAIEFYTKAIDTFSNEPSYYANRAACYIGLKKYLKCIEDCNETLNRDPKFVKALKRKAKSFFLIGNTREAKITYQKAMEVDPSDSSIKGELQEVIMVEKLMVESTNNLENKRYTDALMEIKKALSICPELSIMKIRQVECLAKMGHTENAVQISNSIFNELSFNTDFLYSRGLALLYNGQTDSAKKVFMEGLRLDPDNEKCRTAFKRMNRQEDLKEKGNTEFKSGNYEEALKKYSEAIEMDPNNKNLAAVLYSNRATVLLKMKKHREAIADCNKAIELNETYAKAFIKRAEIRMELEEYLEAGNDFKQAKQLDPSSAANLGQRIQEADREHKKSLRKDYYKILEIEKTADDAEIKKAYRKNALKWHPDKNGQSEEARLTAETKFKDINEAYSILSDPQKKKRFDVGADLDDDFSGGFGGGGVDPNVIFRTFFGGGGGGGDDGFSGGNPFGGFSSGGGFPGHGHNGGFSFKFNKR